MKFADALDARKPILRLGRVRLRFDVHMLVGENVPPLGWRRFAPELAGVLFASAAVASLTAFVVRGAETLAFSGAVAAILAALLTVRLELQKRARHGFVFNYATRTLRIERPARWSGSTRTLLIPFSEIAEAGVTRSPTGYALEVEVKPQPRRAPLVEVLLADVPEAQLEDLFRVAEMARAAFGLPPAAEPEAPTPSPESFEG